MITEKQRELQEVVEALAEEKRRHADAIYLMLNKIDDLTYRIIGEAVAGNPALIERVPAERLSKGRLALTNAARTGGHVSLRDAYQQFFTDIRVVQR